MATTKQQQYTDRFEELLWPALEQSGGRNITLALRAIPFMDAAYARAAALRRAVPRPLDEYSRPTRTACRSARAAGPATRGSRLGNQELLPPQVYPDLYGPELVPRGLDYLFGPPGPQLLVRVRRGNRSKDLAYGNNRADFSFIAGGVVPGVLMFKPDFLENMDDWPFLWGENEYVMESAPRTFSS